MYMALALGLDDRLQQPWDERREYCDRVLGYHLFIVVRTLTVTILQLQGTLPRTEVQDRKDIWTGD